MFEMIISAYRWIFLQMSSVFGLGWSIVLLSCICSALMAPLMRAVAGIVRREADYQSVILPQIAAIKAKYASDMDRHAHIQALYERYGYSPLSPIKKVLPLFVQIPFLLLTYFMLKGTAELSGVEFLFLNNLGEPDAILRLRLLPSPINLLPFVMTGVNLITVFATPGFTVRDQVQAIAIALLFLVMLYTAPSALLLYWTLNNVITCVRTLSESCFSGGPLLISRVVSLRRVPSSVSRIRLSNAALAYGIVIASVMSFYLFALQYLIHGTAEASIVFHFSRWTFNCVFLFAVIFTFVLFRRDRTAPGWCLWLMLSFVSIAVIPIVVTICSLPFTKVVLNRVELSPITVTRCFAVSFILWVFVLLFAFRYGIGRGLKILTATFLKDFAWLLIPVILGIHYSFSSENLDVTAASVARLSAYLLLPPLLLSAVYILVLNRWADASLVLKFVFGISISAYLMPMFSTMSGFWLGYSSNIVLRLALIAVVSVAVTKINNRKVMSVFVLVLTVVSIVNSVVKDRLGRKDTVDHAANSSTVALCPELARSTCVRTNNVYLLVYDSYAHDIIMKGLGFPNRINGFLREEGFTRYDSYTVGGGTIASMSALFTIGGVKLGSSRSMVAGNNVFSDFLKDAGYRTSYLLCGYTMPKRAERMPGDEYFPSPLKVVLSDSVLFPWIIRGILAQAPNVFNRYSADEWNAAKYRIISDGPKTRAFVYAHCGAPGHATWNPTYWRGDDIEIGGFKQRTLLADEMIKRDVKLIDSKDEDAIVIIASDHGGFLMMPKMPGDVDACNLLDRHGIMLHIRWPKGYQPVLDMTCFQNVLLEVLICLTGNSALKELAVDGVTEPLPYPLGTPVGAIKNGVIRYGRDAGKPLFKAATAAVEK